MTETTVQDEIYLATILLEANRWKTREPSFRVSDWINRIADAGFDGLELWDNHALLAPEDELDRLREGPTPVVIFNSYNDCSDETAEGRRRVSDMVRRLGARGMKFNVGKDRGRREEYLRNVRRWRESLPEDFRMCCECHRGSVLEDQDDALRVFEEMEPARVEMILHPLHRDADPDAWGSVMTPRLSHAHMAVKDPTGGGRRLRLDEEPALVRERVRQMRALGFRGSWTIEFTKGVKEHEDIERLFDNAAADLHTLREILQECPIVET